MNSKAVWKECFVDAERGLAVFDDLTIYADSIMNPRQDRVFPIFKKEQVFMCRQMAPLFAEWQTRLRNDGGREQALPLALDAGTGSGVLAIFAAKHGCKVYAPDISPRAIEFARYNAKINDVLVFEDRQAFEEAGQPGIWFRQQRYDEHFANSLIGSLRDGQEGYFDFVMLNPPYNPTFIHVNPALHANGGEDGQREFNQQIRLVPRLLRIGGYCIGHQMGVIEAGQQHPNVVARIDAAFREYNDSPNCRARGHSQVEFHASGDYVKVLKTDCSVREFLEAEYSNYLKAGGNIKEDLRDYIDRVASQWAEFSLLYFEFEKQIVPSGGHPSVSMREDTACEARPRMPGDRTAKEWNWETRKWLHRCIVQHATSSTAVPWPSLFTDYVFSDQTLLSRDSGATEGASSLQGRSSPMWLVNQWLAELPPRHEPPFDLIHIESVPYTQYVADMPGLRQEAAVWLAPDCEGAAPHMEDTENVSQLCLDYWTTCVKILHDNRIAPLLHPAYLGTDREFGETDWNPLMQSFLRHPGNDGPWAQEFPPVGPPNEPGRYPELDRVYRALDEQFGRLRADISRQIAAALAKLGGTTEGPTTSRKVMNNWRYRSWCDTNALEDLRVRQAKEYRDRCKSRMHEIYSGHEQDLNDQKKAKMDLEYCHSTLHGTVAHAFRTSLPRPLRWSQLLSVPLDLSDPLNTGEMSVLPTTFRGSIFIFVGSFRDDWSPRKDHLLFDLARFAALLYNGRFNVEEAKRVHRAAEKSQLDTFAHQTSAVIDSIVRSFEQLPGKVLDDMGVSLVARLHLLKANIASYRSPELRVDPGEFPYRWGTESPLAVYRDIGIQLGLIRALTASHKEPDVRVAGRTALKPENQPGQAGFEKYRQYFAELPVVRPDVSEHLKHSNFAVLMFLVIKQAVYHTIRAHVKRTDAEPICIAISPPEPDVIFECRIDNPRVDYEDGVELSKDAIELRELAAQLSAIPGLPAAYSVDGPLFDRGQGKWSTTVRIIKAPVRL